MKKIIILFVLCFPSFLFAQSNTKVEVLGSLDFSYRQILRLGSFNSDKGKINTHFGVNYFQKIKPKLWLKIGVGFVSEGYKTKKTNLVFVDQIIINGPDGSIDLGSGEKSQFIYNYHFLEVPFSLHFDFSEKKLKPFVEFGFVPMYYLQSITKHKLGGETRSKRNEQESIIRDFQLATKIAFGFTYSFNEKWEMVVQPNFRYHLSAIAKASVKEHLWSGGLALGMRMALK